MTYKDLLNEFSYINYSRDKRTHYTQMVFENPDLVPLLLQIIFDLNSEIGCRAGWVLECVCKKDTSVLMPYMDDFTTQMSKVHLDSVVRPVARICEYLVENHVDKKVTPQKQFLKPIHLERIIDVNFEYLMYDHKTAPKVHAIQSLFRLGFEFPWVHSKLQTILEQKSPDGSKEYKTRALKFLNQIKLITK